MRKRVFNWQGQGFVYLGLEGKAGEALDQQSKALFARPRTSFAPSAYPLRKTSCAPACSAARGTHVTR